jgi:hypothetical protein
MTPDPTNPVDLEVPLTERDVAESMKRAQEAIVKSGKVLAEANEILARFESFSEKNNLHLVDGRQALAGDNAFPARKFVFESLFFELDHLDTRVKEMTGELDSGKARPSIGARAIGNRYRI